eukprot:gene3310-3532_t
MASLSQATNSGGGNNQSSMIQQAVSVCTSLPGSISPIRLPITEWLPKYTKELLFKDLIAGLTVFVFLVPQGMAYALLAGMPPVYGLYSATVPLYIYAIFGTSQQLSIGPMAITSLLLGVTCQKYGYTEGSSDYIRIVMSITFLVGVFTFFLGLFRLGSLSNVISHSVLTGFLTASALVIAVSQVKYLFGIHVPRFDYNHQTVIYILVHLPETKWAAVLVGGCALAVLIGVREWKKKNKSSANVRSILLFRILTVLANFSNFLIIIFGAIIAHVMVASNIDIDIIGSVPSGIMPPSFQIVELPQLIDLVPSSLAIAFVAFAGNWAVGVKYATLNHYTVDATQELVGTGVAMIVGVFFNSFVVAGGLARSAVNAESGAMTQLSSCFTATFMIIALLSLTSFFYYIPMTVLAAVIEVSIISMIDFDSMIKAYKKDRRDCFVMVITFLFTFFLGVTEGLFVGICISIAMVMKTTAFPHIVILGKLPDQPTGQYRDIKRFPEAEQIPGYAIIRMDASLYFANCNHFKSSILSAANGKFHTDSESIHTVIIDASAWVDIDLMGIQTLFELRDECNKHTPNKIQLLIACAKGMIRDRLKECQYIETVNMQSSFFMSIDDAILRRRPCLSI